MSPQSLFEGHSEAILDAIRAGASIPDAANAEGVAHPTVKGWLSRGRKDPTSKYGTFAADVDQALDQRKLPSTDDLPADRTELLVLVTRAARAGSVPAMRLLSELLDPDGGEAGDELSDFDKLARNGAGR